MSSIKIMFIAVFSGIILLTAGCGGMIAQMGAPYHDEGVLKDPALKDNEGIVFGLIAVKYYTTKGEWVGTSNKANNNLRYQLHIGREGGGNIITRELAIGMDANPLDLIDGNINSPVILFARKLPAGTYEIDRVTAYSAFINGQKIWRDNITFTVTPGKATYIGSMRIDFREQYDMQTNTPDYSKAIKTTDEMEDAVGIYTKKNPGSKAEIIKNILQDLP